MNVLAFECQLITTSGSPCQIIDSAHELYPLVETELAACRKIVPGSGIVALYVKGNAAVGIVARILVATGGFVVGYASLRLKCKFVCNRTVDKELHE